MVESAVLAGQKHDDRVIVTDMGQPPRTPRRPEYYKLKASATAFVFGAVEEADPLREARAAVFTATSDGARREAITAWTKARDALPDPAQRLLEDERAADSPPPKLRIPALQEQAARNTLKEVDALPDLEQKVIASMFAFSYAPSGSAVGQEAVASVFKHMEAVSDPGKRAKAAKFVAVNALEGSELKRNAQAMFAQFPMRQKLPAVLYSLWNRLDGP